VQSSRADLPGAVLQDRDTRLVGQHRLAAEQDIVGHLGRRDGGRGDPSLVGEMRDNGDAAAVGAVVVLVVAIWLVPLLLTRHPSAGLTAAARLTAENNARTPVVAALAVVGAAALTAGVTWRATKSTLKGQEIDRQGQLTDRYTKAIEQLGSDKLDVRIGSIYALERVARDSPPDHPAVMEVLAAFIREHSHEQWWPPEPATDDLQPRRTTRPDVQTAITVIGRRNASYDLGRIDLAAANLSGADLTGTRLSDADLTGARLTGADLTGAKLADADLTHANLTHANLSRANLTHANLSRANLTRANLSRARLTEADLIGADLSDADLTGVNLMVTDNSSTAYLGGAQYLGGTPVPEGWVRDPASDRLERDRKEPGDAL
jgi:Pentapeptide repeats (8 copies)